MSLYQVELLDVLRNVESCTNCPAHTWWFRILCDTIYSLLCAWSLLWSEISLPHSSRSLRGLIWPVSEIAIVNVPIFFPDCWLKSSNFFCGNSCIWRYMLDAMYSSSIVEAAVYNCIYCPNHRTAQNSNNKKVQLSTHLTFTRNSAYTRLTELFKVISLTPGLDNRLNYWITGWTSTLADSKSYLILQNSSQHFNNYKFHLPLNCWTVFYNIEQIHDFCLAQHIWLALF